MFATHAMSQTFQLLPNGFVDSSNPDKDYIVIEFSGLSQNQIYNKALSAINKNCASSKNVISQVENSQITLNATLPNVAVRHNLGFSFPYDMSYSLALEFKDGKLRINAPKIKEILQVQQGAGLVWVRMYVSKNDKKSHTRANKPYIYNKKGKLENKKHKESIENATNTLVSNILTDMQIPAKHSDW